MFQDSSLCINFDSRSGQPLTVHFKDDSHQIAPEEIVENNILWNDWACVRVQFALDLSTSGSDYKTSFVSAVRKVHEGLTGKHKPVFNIAGTKIHLNRNGTVTGAKKDSKVSSIIQTDAKGKKPTEPTGFDVVKINILLDISTETISLTDNFRAKFFRRGINSPIKTSHSEL